MFRRRKIEERRKEDETKMSPSNPFIKVWEEGTKKKKCHEKIMIAFLIKLQMLPITIGKKMRNLQKK